MLLAIALLACGKDDADSDVPVLEPSPYIYDEQDPPAPTYTLEQIAAGVQAAVDEAAAIGPEPALAAYDAAMMGQSGACPSWYDDGDATFWYDQCTSETGTSFSGYAYTLSYVDVYDEAENTTTNGRAVFAAASVETGDGHRFAGAGTVYDLRTTQPSEDGSYVVTFDQILVQGAFEWDGPEADGTWIAEGVSPDLYVIRYSADVLEPTYFGVDGGLSPLAGDMVAVAFDEVTLTPIDFGSACDVEPAGTISVRGEDGSWYDVLFDGPTETDPDVPADECDGCGQVYYQGEPMGEACADFSAWLVKRAP
jgi:hypothetical protein